MKVTKDVVTRYKPGRAPVCGFVAYVSTDPLILMRRLGWETGDDVHDDHFDQISYDNGKTWSEPRPSLANRKADNGYIYFIEFAPLLLRRQRKFVLATNQRSQQALHDWSAAGHNKFHITINDISDDGRLLPREPLITDFDLPEPALSFCVPLEDQSGRVLIPINSQKRDVDGSLHRLDIPLRTDKPDIAVDWGEMKVLIGEPQKSGEFSWYVGGAVPMDVEKSTRGLCEGAITELSEGRLAMIMRGSNGRGPAGGPNWGHMPGYKWLSLSKDGGQTWSKAEPLRCDDGSMIESSSTGSTIFRSIKNGKLYWMGNLCIDGERPDGNWPRSPLVLAEVQEEPFALKRNTITVLDRRKPEEDQYLQLSNFKHYQDRETGDLVFYLTRYGERGGLSGRWLLADQYQYRVEIG
jgi:hypothetical protein